jgi:AraC-like DNA-binding protein
VAFARNKTSDRVNVIALIENKIDQENSIKQIFNPKEYALLSVSTLSGLTEILNGFLIDVMIIRSTRNPTYCINFLRAFEHEIKERNLFVIVIDPWNNIKRRLLFLEHNVSYILVSPCSEMELKLVIDNSLRKNKASQFISQSPTKSRSFILNKNFLVTIDRIIDENIYSKTLNWDRLESDFKCSRTLINRKFIDYKGISLAKYFKQKRIEKAKSMIESNSIEKVAQKLNFNSLGGLKRLFYAVNGYSIPSKRPTSTKLDRIRF